MALIQATRGAQPVMSAEFAFSFNDTMKDVAGVTKTFGAAFADAGVFDAINLPLGAVVVGGELIVETAFVGIGAGATIIVGIAGDTAALLASTDLDAAAAGSRTALLLTKPLVSNGGQNIRITTAGLTATATAGKVRLRVQYTIDGRQDEVCAM